MSPPLVPHTPMGKTTIMFLRNPATILSSCPVTVIRMIDRAPCTHGTAIVG